MFPTKYNCSEREIKPSCSGSNKKALYQYNGKKELVLNGKYEDTQEKIQSYSDQCDINILIKRFTLGDDSALNQVRGFYADVTNFPTSYIELYDKVEDCKRLFYSLKPEVREEFGDNPVEFFDTYGSKEFIEKIKKFDVDVNVPVNDSGIPASQTEERSDVNVF